MKESDLTAQIIGGAIEVHKNWGPGLYEEIYERSLCHELRLRKVAFESQVKLPLIYKGERVGEDLRLAKLRLKPTSDAQLLAPVRCVV